MHQVYHLKNQCYGCGACRNICPVSAISMEEDEEGFLYPVIRQEKCIDCGMCKNICPYHGGTGETLSESPCTQTYFAVQHKNPAVVAESSSGGMFTALSDCVLGCGGIVYGAAFDHAFKVAHERAETQEQRNAFRGSKYIQSSMDRVYRLIQEDLEQNRLVLFTGTPCQAAGVRNYILQKRGTLDRLVLCDFICHGAASPKVWESYLQYFKEKYDGGLTQYAFRNKRNGWKQGAPLLKTKDSDISDEYARKKSFLQLYRTCYLSRPSCYACQYAGYSRCSDITIGDFWNIGSVCPSMDDNTGTSQVLVNTETGRKWFDLCWDTIKCCECGKKDVWQPHLEYPANVNFRKREKFWENCRTLPFERVLKKYGQGDIMARCKSFAIPVVKKLGLYVLAGKLYRMIFVRKEK